MTSERHFDEQRHQLVYGDLASSISDRRVLEALNQTPRHLFVPPELVPQAYLNRALSIGYGQTISQPLIVAMMTSALNPLPGQRILEIGTGSGYQAAVLSRLVADVYTIELIDSLARSTASLLDSLNLKNIHCRTGDGNLGWAEHAPFDGIMVTAAPEQIPPALTAQLKEGGRMVIPVGSSNQRLKVLRKRDGKLVEEDLGAVRFVPMLGKSEH